MSVVTFAAVGGVAGAAGLVAPIFGLGPILSGALVYGGLALVGRSLAPKLPQLGQREARTQTIRSAVTPARYVLGVARVGGNLAYIAEDAEDDRVLHMVLALAEGPCASVDKVWMNGKELELRIDDAASSDTLFPTSKPRTVRRYTPAQQLQLDGYRRDLAAINDGSWRTYVGSGGQLVFGSTRYTYKITPTVEHLQWLDRNGGIPRGTGITGLMRAYYERRIAQLEAAATEETVAPAPGANLREIWQWWLRWGQLKGHSLTPARVVLRPPPDSDYADHIEIQLFLNGGNTGPPGDDWGRRHRLSGLCSVYIKLTQSEYGNDVKQRVFDRIPEFNFLVYGLKFVWPGQLTRRWTNNAAAVRWWYERTQVGRPADSMDEASFQEAYRTCARQVGGAGGFSRYTINGILHSGEDPAYVGEQMDIAWQGYCVEHNGRLFFRPGAEREPVGHIDADDGASVVGTGAYRAQPALQDRINTVTLTLAGSETAEYLEQSLPEYTDNSAYRRDGVHLRRDLGSWDFVYAIPVAQRLRAILLRRMQHLAELEYVIAPGDDFANLDLKPTDIVTVSDKLLGFNRARFMIASRRLESGDNWAVRLTLIEHPSGIYADTAVVPLLRPRALTPPASSTPPPPPRGLFASAAVDQAADGSIASTLSILWLPSRHSAAVRITGPAGHSTEHPAPGASLEVEVPLPGRYEVEVRLLSATGIEGPAATTSVEVDWSLFQPPAPQLLALRNHGGSAQLTLAAARQPDIAGLEVRAAVKTLDSVDAFDPVQPSDWDALVRMDVAPMIASAAGNLVATVTVPQSGRWRMFGRFVTRQGVYSALGDFGEHRFSLPPVDTGVEQSHPLWLGDLSNMAVLGDNDLLVVDPPDPDAVTLDGWDGRLGWPFGSVPAGGGYQYATAGRQLRGDDDDAIRVQARAAVGMVTPPGHVVPPVSTATLRVEARLTTTSPWVHVGDLVAGSASWQELESGATPFACRWVRLVFVPAVGYGGSGLDSLELLFRKTPGT